LYVWPGDAAQASRHELLKSCKWAFWLERKMPYGGSAASTSCTCADAGTLGGAWRAAKPALEKLALVALLLMVPAEAFARPVEDL